MLVSVAFGLSVNSSTESGANMSAASVVFHLQHGHKLPGSFDLGKPAEIGREAHRVATSRVGQREVGPFPGAEIDLEATKVLVGATRVARHELVTLDASAVEPAATQGGGRTGSAAALMRSKSTRFPLREVGGPWGEVSPACRPHRRPPTSTCELPSLAVVPLPPLRCLRRPCGQRALRRFACLSATRRERAKARWAARSG